MPDLYPTFEVPDLSANETGEQPQYKPSAYFDFENGDFAVDSKGRIREANGIEAWEQWCLKAVYTQKEAFLSYTAGYGTQTDAAFAQPTREETETAFEQTITDAILADPYNRTIYVRNFVFTWQTDGLLVLFDVVGDEDKIAHIQAKL